MSHDFYIKKCILAVKTCNLISLYNILVSTVSFFLKLIAPFNLKIKLGVAGRRSTFNRLSEIISSRDSCIWFHCSSLGEYEQGLPVFEEIKKLYPNHKIILTFFSPSGFEIRKSAPVADIVVYLPLDTKKNAKHFLDLVHPELILFVKYEIWPCYLQEIKKRRIKSILISAIFRQNQIYFKPLGKWMQKYFIAFDHFFVQNEASKRLLNSIGYDNVTISGDTRFDRVSKQLEINNTVPLINEFIDSKICFIAGSTWSEGEKYICNYINSNQTSGVKFIIAPHDIKPNRINDLTNKLKVPYALFSDTRSSDLIKYNVLIIDTIGILSKLYSYGDLAYVGGAIGTSGLHNILEPSVFGIPIIIGKNHSKFPEAKLMIENGGVFAIKTEDEFKSTLDTLIVNKEFRAAKGKLNAAFIQKNRGAVVQIVDYIRR